MQVSSLYCVESRFPLTIKSELKKYFFYTTNILQDGEDFLDN